MLDEPVGLKVRLEPSAHVLKTEFEANVVDPYVAARWATDREDKPCGDSLMRVFAIEPSSTLYRELIWHTPVDSHGDRRESDKGK